MKVGDKVFIELEVEEIDKSDNTFKGLLNKGISHWVDINQVITQLPIQDGRWMMVSDGSDLRFCERRFVIGKADGLFVSYNHQNGFRSWIYAKEIPAKRKLTMQEIAEKFNEDVDNIEIEK